MHKLKKILLAGLVLSITSLSLTACSSSNKSMDTSQSLQKAHVSRPLKPKVCNMADILRDNYNLDQNHSIAVIAVAMSENPDLNPRISQVGSNNMGIFQVPKSQLRKQAKSKHLAYNSINFQIYNIMHRPQVSQFKHKSGSAKELAAYFEKYVMKVSIIDHNHINRNIHNLEY